MATFAKALPEILKCAQDILESKQNSYELKRQKRKFDRYVSKVEDELRHLLKTRSRPVPRDLLRASLALVNYCKARIVKAETFYKRFAADPWTFRFITHMARVFGKDKIRLLKRRLGEGEDWLRIALAAVALYVNNSPNYLPRDSAFLRVTTCIENLTYLQPWEFRTCPRGYRDPRPMPGTSRTTPPRSRKSPEIPKRLPGTHEAYE